MILTRQGMREGGHRKLLYPSLPLTGIVTYPPDHTATERRLAPIYTRWED
jgi:hypothetical protein